MDTVIVGLAVAAAAFFVGRKIFRNFTRTGDAGCGCSGCSNASSCGQAASGAPQAKAERGPADSGCPSCSGHE